MTLDAPSIRAEAASDARIADLEREVRDYRLTQKRCDERIKELREALAGVLPLLSDTGEFRRLSARQIVARVARAERALSGAGDDKGDRG